MKRLIIAVFAALSLVSMFTCAGGAPANQNAPVSRSSVRYTGNGGKDMSLAILVPSASGLVSEQNYLPTMVQGVLVGDIANYSAIRVLDRQTLEKTLKETESGIYKNEADYGQLGQIANVDYALTGSIAKTNSGYAMQIQVVGTGKNNIGVTKASYSGSCTIAELDNFTGIRKASLELLTQMGVVLTDSAKRELSGAGQTNYVNAQTSLAKGIVAQRGGNIVETMARFYEANSYDPSLAEAAARANAVSRNVRAGNVGESLRGLQNDRAWRQEWIKILNDAVTYLWKQRFAVAEVSYTNLGLKARADYKTGTLEFTYNPNNIWVKPLPFPRAYLNLIDDLNKGLQATGRNRDWGLEPLYAEGIIPVSGYYLFADDEKTFSRAYYELASKPIRGQFGAVRITVSLVNSKGQVVGANTRDSKYQQTHYRTVRLGNNAQGITIYEEADNFLMGRTMKILARPGVKYSAGKLSPRRRQYDFSFGRNDIENSFTIDANSDLAKDITDEMALQVTAEFLPVYYSNSRDEGTLAEKYSESSEYMEWYRKSGKHAVSVVFSGKRVDIDTVWVLPWNGGTILTSSPYLIRLIQE